MRGARCRCDDRFERGLRLRGFLSIAGLDEAGRGSLFGPVFAAAVILSPVRLVRGLRDSKQLEPKRREDLAAQVKARAVSWAVASADSVEIDRINILQASRLAMKRAVEQLDPRPDFLLVDAVSVDLPIPQRGLIHGDALCRSIAAASILAKVHRDAAMREWDAVYPQYGLARGKGYPTAEHLAALKAHGPSPHHRFTYDPVRRLSAPMQLDLPPAAGTGSVPCR